MGLEYELSDVRNEETLRDLRLELSPRNQCRDYVSENGGKATLILKKDFDNHYRKNEFEDGPFKDNFGDDTGEPYMPNRQIFGKLKSGLIVYCESSDAFKEKSEELLKSIE